MSFTDRLMQRQATTSVDVAARQESDERQTVWAFVWILFGFKIGTVVVIAWAAGATTEAGLLLSATTWPWLVVPALALSGPLLYRVRLRRVRARREALRRSEWMLE